MKRTNFIKAISFCLALTGGLAFGQDYQSGSMLYSSEEGSGMITVQECCESFSVEIMDMNTGSTEVMTFTKSENGPVYVAKENSNYHLYFPEGKMYGVQYITETMEGVDGKFIDADKVYAWSHIRSALRDPSKTDLQQLAQEGHQLMYPRKR